MGAEVPLEPVHADFPERLMHSILNRRDDLRDLPLDLLQFSLLRRDT